MGRRGHRRRPGGSRFRAVQPWGATTRSTTMPTGGRGRRVATGPMTWGD